jgi:hypothetical protein
MNNQMVKILAAMLSLTRLLAAFWPGIERKIKVLFRKRGLSNNETIRKTRRSRTKEESQNSKIDATEEASSGAESSQERSRSGSWIQAKQRMGDVNKHTTHH